jgi:hypothetical protein
LAAERRATKAAEKLAAKEAADAAASAEIEAAKEGLVAGKPRITETVKAPGQSMSTTFGAPPKSGLTPFEEEMLKRASSVKPVGAGPKVTVTQPAPAAAPKATYRGMQEALEEGGESFPLYNVDAPGHRLHGSTVGADTLRREGIAIPEASAGIPATKSRNPLSSLDDRLTDSDVESLKEIVTSNPAISVEEATAELLKQRAQRSAMYRSNAGLNRLEQAALDREIP